MNKFENSLDIAGRVGLGNLSKHSISRRLSNAGIHSRIAAIKDILSDVHRACRLHFARRYVNYPLEFWRWVVFTDEKSWSSASHGQIKVRRLRNERFARKNIYSIKRSGRTTASVWGGMWLCGLTPLYRVMNNLTSALYFSSTIHNAIHTRNWLAQHPRLVALDWPTKGADMNPIENVWGYFVCKLKNSRTPEGMPFHARDSNNSNQLFDLVSYEWGKLMAEKAYLHNLSMPIRFQSVIDAQGG